jgi:hypothetical protein
MLLNSPAGGKFALGAGFVLVVDIVAVHVAENVEEFSLNGLDGLGCMYGRHSKKILRCKIRWAGQKGPAAYVNRPVGLIP